MNLKILGLVALIATALVAVPTVSQATTVTSPTGTVTTSENEGESENGHITMDNPIAKLSCTSKIGGSIGSHGAGVTAKGNVSLLTFTNCTNSWHVTTITAGSLEAHYVSGYNATMTSSGATIEATRLGVACRYATNNTDMGMATGGTPVTLDIAAAIPFHSGSGLCGTGATTLTGSYVGNGSAYYDA